MKVRPAQAILNEISDGKALEELALAFHDAIAAVREFGKPASVTLAIKIDTLGADQHKLVEPPVIFTHEVATKLPKAPPPATVFFVDADGNATRNQTKQQELALTIAAKTVEGEQ